MNLPIFTVDDYEICAIEQRGGYLVTEGGVVLENGFPTLKAVLHFMKELDCPYCPHCEQLWSLHDFPICPHCNAGVKRQINKLEQVWLDSRPEAGDVLDMSLGDDGRLIVKTYKLYSR